MNKRIKLLLEQSGLQPYYDAQEGQIEKFAQLIVKECLSKVNKAVYAREMSGRYYPDSDGKKILKHFGVEE